ncbi:hypothetical protein NW768_010200 [Fusarium equiseti]|uniref:Uncharacterized protein n=1 Tax=Fusarium equiseti TaxID=61235 RepID=A0ABQ8R155_FUSEQ|nr:hypothetical protein NW768_010200 [Fusarium equiseti]
MRFALLCSIALGADIVVGSVCKPRQSTDSSSGTSVKASSTVSEISSVTTAEFETATAGDQSSDTTISTGSATSTDLETTTTFLASLDTTTTSDVTVTTASIDPSTSAATLTVEDETTTDTMTAELSSTYTEEITMTSSGSDTTTLAETTTTALDESTTTLAETTTTAAAPIETAFQIFANDKGPLTGLLVDSSAQLGFLRPNIPTPEFAIEPTTSFVVTNNLYMCVNYNVGPYQPYSVVLCNESRKNRREWGFVTCEKTVDHGLVCSVLAVTCGMNLVHMTRECGALGGSFSQFYLEPQGSAFGLLLGSKDHNPGGSVTTVDLQTE